MLFDLVTALLLVASSQPRKPPPAPAFEPLAAQAAQARESDRLDEALALYQRALELRPSWAEGWWYAGTLYYDRNAYSNAAEAFRKVVALSPTHGTAQAMLGLCEFELGQDDAALTHLQEAGRLGVAGGESFQNVLAFHEGVLLQRSGKLEAAREKLQRLCLGGVQTGELALALGTVALRIRSRGPGSSDAAPDTPLLTRVGRAQCLAAQKKYDEARRDYSALVQEFPNYPGLHYAFGRFLIEANDTPAGIAELEREIRANPADIFARLEVATAKYKTDSAGGLAYAKEAVRIDPRLPQAHYLLGLLLLDTDDYLHAIPELEVAAQAFPEETRIFVALGSAYWRAGRAEDAKKARTRARELTERENQKTAAGSVPPAR